MTILEIERRSGLDRTNIRFYEREGLIAPARHENGYRDYSDDDLQLLLKIKLFRRLGFSLQAIRAMQNDDAAMERVLAERLAAIGAERRQLDAAGQVCQALRTDGARFSTLDAQAYLNSYQAAVLSAGQPAQLPKSVSDADRIALVYCPFRRWLARSLDLSLSHIAVLAVLSLFARLNVTAFGAFAQWFWVFAAALFWLLIEPLLLSKFGTTPGKWLLGIRLEHASGRRLTYSEAYRRTAQVFFRGQGLLIPVIHLFCLGRSLWVYMQKGAMGWDEETDVIAEETRPRFVLRYIAAVIGVVLLLAVVIFAPWMPPNRGDLTVDEFVENFNTLAAYHDMDYLVLASDGSVATQRTTHGSGNESAVMNLFISMDKGDPIRLVFTEENGVLTAVGYERIAASTWGGSFTDYTGKAAIQLTTQAFAWADSNLFSALLSSSRLKPFFDLAGGTQTADITGCELTYSVTPLPGRLEEDGNTLTQALAVFSITRRK